MEYQMKKMLIIVALISLTLSISAKVKIEVNVPAVVKDAFAKLFPNVKEVKWEKENKDYEAGFVNNGEITTANFDKKGNLLETETIIDIANLPKTIEEYLAEKYNGFRISEVSKVVDVKGVITYETEITKGKIIKDLIFNQNGKFIKISKEED